FLAAVRKQLERIVPAKRQRQFVQKLVAFREAVERVLPLARAAAALNDPVPLPEAVRGLFRFVLRTTRARDGVLVVRQPGADGGAERLAVYDPDGQRVAARPVPFARSLAASVLSLQEPCAMGRPESSDVTELQPFEEGRTSVLAAPVPVGEGVQVVVELFDKQPRSEGEPIRFTEEDKRFLAAAAEFGAELLRQALAERQTHQLLLDAVAAALEASERVARDIQPGAEGEPGEPPSVLDRLREGLSASAGAVVDAESSLRLAEAIRELAARHGPAAVRHCVTLVEGVRRLLDETSGTWEG
ncbi:MAG TPA: transcriptional regulator, partial [Gemmataceae bacterium]